MYSMSIELVDNQGRFYKSDNFTCSKFNPEHLFREIFSNFVVLFSLLCFKASLGGEVS